MRTRKRKTISTQQIKGQRGVNLIERIVLDMGYVWHAAGSMDAGIDGYIEIRDPKTGEVTNNIILVQSKSGDSYFHDETNESFCYDCSSRDLEYWLDSNAPVVLIVSRLSTNEAYWMPVRSYFADLQKRSSHRIMFDKRRHVFCVGCRDDLVQMAVPPGSAHYITPTRIEERLYSNLLRVAYYPDTVYLAESDCRRRDDAWAILHAAPLRAGNEWILKEKRILSFRDLREEPWPSLCDRGSVEEFSTDEWALADDDDRRRDFVQLLNCCLRAKCHNLDIQFHPDRHYHYFRATEDGTDKSVSYPAMAQTTSRCVFRHYPSDRGAGFYRHSAFEGQFRHFEGTWYLEIVPTYHFTWDGLRDHRHGDLLLQQIKRLERNPAILGQVVMWSWLLSKADRGDLFSSAYDLLRFDQLEAFSTDFGIEDNRWLRAEDKKKQREISEGLREEPLRLFDED